MKKASVKTNRNQAHTAKSPKGLGDFYGSGIRAKIGKMRDGIGMQQITKPKMKTPPKSVV